MEEQKNLKKAKNKKIFLKRKFLHKFLHLKNIFVFSKNIFFGEKEKSKENKNKRKIFLIKEQTLKPLSDSLSVKFLALCGW